jgi:hypothetical protein
VGVADSGGVTMSAGSTATAWGTAGAPRFFKGYTEVEDDVRLHGRFYTYVIDPGLVAGVTLSVMCVIDRPVSEVWPYYKDHNLWQNSYDHYYSGVIGDLGEGQRFTISMEKNGPPAGPEYEIIRNLPEYLTVFNQPPIGEWAKDSVMPGYGIVSPGVMSYGVDEYDGQSHVAVFMEHSSVVARPDEIEGVTEEQVIGPWDGMLSDGVRKWKEAFIPNLKELCYTGSLSVDRRPAAA